MRVKSWQAPKITNTPQALPTCGTIARFLFWLGLRRFSFIQECPDYFNKFLELGSFKLYICFDSRLSKGAR